jgi:adenosylhomocysteinase
MDGFEVKKLSSVISNADIVVQLQEIKTFLKKEYFLAMKDKAIVCNIGHFDNEIDMAWLNENYGHTKSEIKPQVDLYTLENDKNYCFGRRKISEFRLCYRPSKFCDE